MTLSSRERNSIIIGLIAVLLFLGLQYIAFPLIEQHKALNNQIEVKASILQQYRARLHMLSSLQEELAERQDHLEKTEHLLIEGLTPALGAARVQLILDALSNKQKGITIKNARVLDSESHGHYTKIAIRIALTAQTKILTEFLYDIEHQPVRLSVSELTIRVPNPKKPRNLRADIVIEALMKQISEKNGKPEQDPEIHPRSATA
tara:strand:- start:60 stop:674 length:615 start_codon:yes stop_codon:yes gene_type:complete